MFVKILPYYQLCAGCCMKFLRKVSCENVLHREQNASDYSERCNNNNHPPEENGHSKDLAVNGNDHVHTHSANGATTTNHDRTRGKENVFERVIRQPPEFIRICCWCFVRRRNESLSPSPDSSPSRQRKGATPLVNSDGLTNVVLPLDGGTVYTPMKNFIGREVDDGCHVIELEDRQCVEQQPQQQLQDKVESPSSSSTGTDERLTNYCSTASTATELELVDGNEENNNNSSSSSRQQVGSHAQKPDLDQRPNLSPSKSYGNGGSTKNGHNGYNSNARFFGAETIETPHRSRYLGEREDGSAAAGGVINQESYIIHRDEQYDSENDEKSSNDSSSTRIISNSTFNFGSKGSDPFPPTPNVSHPPSILSSRPQSLTSHKSIGSGILKNDGRLSRTSNISYSNLSIKQSADNVSIKSNRSAKSRENNVWYERDGTPIRSEDVISSNQVNYESDYDEEVEEEIVKPQRSATPKRYPTPSPHLLQSSYSTEELSNNSYQAEETEISPPKSRVQSASLSNLQQLPDDEEEPPQPAPAKKILRKPFLVRRSSKVAPAKEAVSGIKSKNKMNEVIFQNNLRKFDKPKEALSNCLVHLESPNWEQNISGLQFFVRLIRHHPEVIDSQIHLLSVALTKQVRNLRSQVARAACQASAEFFSTHRRSIEGEAEDIATHLLHRTADTNKFLRADATQALESMCENLSISKVIHIISFKGANHQNAVVRTTAAKLLDKIVHQIGAEKVFALPKETREKLVMTGGQLLLEGSLDTRNYTKSMFKQLSEHPSYNKVLLEVIPPRTYRNIEKALNSIKQL